LASYSGANGFGVTFGQDLALHTAFEGVSFSNRHHDDRAEPYVHGASIVNDDYGVRREHRVIGNCSDSSLEGARSLFRRERADFTV
jgi:hypothetical protein